MPQVHITYEAEVEPLIEVVELPFVVGVLADLCGHPEQPWPPLREREFVQVSRETLDRFVAACSPRLALEVRNKLQEDGAPLKVQLRFRSLADFEPEGIVGQVARLRAAFAEGDLAASRQLDEILHAPEFQRLEASWRGLEYLLGQTETSESIKILALPASKEELLSDFCEAPEPEQSALFHLVLAAPYGVFRADPFSVLIGDYGFANDRDDLELLERLARVALAARAPLIAGAAPRMFGCGDYRNLPEGAALAGVFERDTHARWRAFRESEESQYLALVLPGMLMRLPYGDGTVPVKGFSYQESAAGDDPSPYLWGNPAYALGARLAEAFRLYHWCAEIQGVERGGLVTGLPTRTPIDADGNPEMKCPVEIAVNERQERQLFQLGFTCLVHWKGTDRAAFFATTTCRKPEPCAEPAASRAASLAVRLPYVWAVSRFAHYLKAMLRDRFERPRTCDECERLLNAWIGDYVTDDDSAPVEVKARYPLRSARIQVRQHPDKPGWFQATVFLRPHFQLEDPGRAQRAVIDLPPPVREAPR